MTRAVSARSIYSYFLGRHESLLGLQSVTVSILRRLSTSLNAAKSFNFKDTQRHSNSCSPRRPAPAFANRDLVIRGSLSDHCLPYTQAGYTRSDSSRRVATQFNQRCVLGCVSHSQQCEHRGVIILGARRLGGTQYRTLDDNSSDGILVLYKESGDGSSSVSPSKVHILSTHLQRRSPTEHA